MNSTAIIQFIGIVLFSTGIQRDPGVHAILPRITHTPHVEHAINKGDLHAMTSSDPDTVQDHVAVVLYRTKDVIDKSKGWSVSNKTLSGGWEFVQLDGDQLQFFTTERNPEPKIPAGLPLAMAPNSVCLTEAKEPVQLSEAFQAPNYKGAAGVVNIPFGTLQACTARSGGDNGRVDTSLLLKTDGLLVIGAKNPIENKGKTITLTGNAIVYVANIPPHYLFTGKMEPPTGQPHWMAYTAMLDTTCVAPPETVVADETCDLTPINAAWKEAQANPPSTQWKIFDSSCTNTQWP